jgi:hypothetical protein
LVVQLVDLAVRRVEALLVEVKVESLLADGVKDGADDTFDGSVGRYVGGVRVHSTQVGVERRRSGDGQQRRQ